MERHLLHFGCRHHILEIILEAAFEKCLGFAGAPDIGLFKRFQAHWENISKEKFENVMTDGFALSELKNCREDVINLCNLRLQENYPRDDHQEFLDIGLLLIFLRSKSSLGQRFRAPGHMH